MRRLFAAKLLAEGTGGSLKIPAEGKRKLNESVPFPLFPVRLWEIKPFAGSTWRLIQIRVCVMTMHADIALPWRSI
jgi:hypothetical protein